jgi:hypothetical protein
MLILSTAAGLWDQELNASRSQTTKVGGQALPAGQSSKIMIKRSSKHINQSINQCYICSNEIHREFMPAIHRKSLIWLILTFSTSPSKTTIQIAIDSNLDTRIYS